MIKVLIVEDEAGIRDSLSQAFSWTEIGCELIGSVDSGLAALEFCIHTQPDICLLYTSLLYFFIAIKV